jgi:hypothetical protein
MTGMENGKSHEDTKDKLMEFKRNANFRLYINFLRLDFISGHGWGFIIRLLSGWDACLNFTESGFSLPTMKNH